MEGASPFHFNIIGQRPLLLVARFVNQFFFKRRDLALEVVSDRVNRLFQVIGGFGRTQSVAVKREQRFGPENIPLAVVQGGFADFHHRLDPGNQRWIVRGLHKIEIFFQRADLFFGKIFQAWRQFDVFCFYLYVHGNMLDVKSYNVKPRR